MYNDIAEILNELNRMKGMRPFYSASDIPSMDVQTLNKKMDEWMDYKKNGHPVVRRNRAMLEQALSALS